jgi:hypothetical protein
VVTRFSAGERKKGGKQQGRRTDIRPTGINVARLSFFGPQESHAAFPSLRHRRDSDATASNLSPAINSLLLSSSVMLHYIMLVCTCHQEQSFKARALHGDDCSRSTNELKERTSFQQVLPREQLSLRLKKLTRQQRGQHVERSCSCRT